VLWAGGVLLQRQRPPDKPALMPWQKSFRLLPADQQRLYRAVREGIFEAENVRSSTKQWPSVQALADDGVPPFAPDALTPKLAWEKRQQGVYVAYLGRPASRDALRWLILFIEPEPTALKGPGDKPPPVDEEHHTLPDGTALHVQVWTQLDSEPEPVGVPAFPVAEGWTQRVGQGP